MIFTQKWFGYRVNNGIKSSPFEVDVPGNIQYDYGYCRSVRNPYGVAYDRVPALQKL